LDVLDRLVRAELIEVVESERDHRRTAFGVMFACALVAIAGTVLAALLFRRWVLQPLDDIIVAAEALTADDDYPLPEFDAPELAAVSAAVGTLQRSLRRARDEAVASYDALEQSAVLAIQVRSQLADELGDMPEGWHVTTLLEPAEGLVAGDCFDIGLLDQHRMYVVLIDVTGHGASAALNALKAKSQLRAALRNRREPGSAIDWMSREMLKDTNADLLTASVMVIDLHNGMIRYANAGHPPALITDGSAVELLEQPGPIVGAFEATWTTGTAELPPGWTLVVHTDGITETLGPERERFGDARLLECLSTPDPEDLLRCIQDAVDDFRVGPPTDDVTAIAVHRTVAAEHESHGAGNVHA
jgi:serine phosphatase RsbU (regulator of sigma subunit)